MLGQVQSGQLKALAVTGKERFPAVPDVPAAIESGVLPDYDVTTWYGMLVPGSTPAPIRDRLYKEMSEILRSPDIAARLRDIGADPGGEPPAEFAAFIKNETEKWIKVAKGAHISVD